MLTRRDVRLVVEFDSIKGKATAVSWVTMRL